MSLKINNFYTDIKYLFELKKKHTPFFPRKIDDKLIRGRSVSSPIHLYSLKKQGVTQIIDLRNKSTELSEILPQYIERFLCKIFNIHYINFRYNHKIDGLPNTNFFQQINEKITNNNGRTYIHCRHGKRRTGVCVAIYEKLYTNKSKKEILNELYYMGFSELYTKENHLPQRVFNRLTKIYNNFITAFYPEEPKLSYKMARK